jgi:outer membrane protein OmpA-like peptidoglycan-associated protein
MKKAFITLCVIMMTTATVFAAGGNEPTRYYTPKFTQGWFIDLAGTYSIFAANGSAYHHAGTFYGLWPAENTLSGKPFIGGSVKLGKRVSPSFAVRAGYDLRRSGNQYGTFHYKSLHVDVMESPIDLFFGYNPDRFYTLWVYGGMAVLGQDHQGYFFNRQTNFEFGFNGGFMNNFRISNSIDFHIDLTATATRWSFDDTYADINPNGNFIHKFFHRMHFDFTAEAGFMWYLGGRRFTAVEPQEVVKTDCSQQEARINELMNQVNSLQQQLSNNGYVPGATIVHDTIVKTVEAQSVSYPFSIFFNKGSYELRDGRDRVNIEEFAKAAKENGYKVILRGTCDSATGSAAFNKTLAEKRCNKIKSELVKYGVPESNITINAAGAVKELGGKYPTDYDRRVMIQLSK